MKLIKYLIYLIIGAALFTGLYFGYKFYLQAKEKTIDALYLIPDNAAIIIGSSDYNSLKNEWKKAEDLSKLFEKDETFFHEENKLDSIYNKVNSYAKENNSKLTFYYSIHFVGHKKFASILSFSFNKVISTNSFETVLKKNGSIKIRDFESGKIYQFSFKDSKEKYFIAFEHSNMFISKYEPIIERLILEEESANIEKHNNIDKMIKIRGKDAAASIYINYRYLYRLISSLSQKEYIETIKQIGSLSQYSVLDFNSQKNSISLSGYSFCSDSITNMLSSFDGFDAPNVEIYNHIPAQTILLYYQGAERFNKYLTKKANTSYSTENKLAIESYKADLMVDVTDYFYPWIKSELALGMLGNSTGDNEWYALANTYDKKEALQTLGKLESIALEYKNTDADSISYRSYDIHYIPLPYLLSNIFGDLFTPIQQTYYCAIDNYIVFANSPKTLKTYIDNMLINKTLANRDDFNEIFSKLNTQAHIVLYANLHYFNEISKLFLNTESINYIKSSSLNFNEIGDIAIEFIKDNNGTYTTLNISKTQWEEDADKVSWQVALDYPIAKGPYPFENHQTNKIDFIVFDNHNQMYRINNLGQIVWAIPVAELPIEGISVVDYYKNGKHQILYNSSNYLYLYDINGNKVENYPIAINPPATAALTLIDYDKRKNYRILIPLSDGKIHNYKIEGIETTGWQNPSMPVLVKQEVQYFKLGSKDFLILADTAGDVLFSNRRGEARIEARLAFTNNTNTKFYKLNNKLITTDRIGRIITIDASGKVEKKLLGDFTPNHYFDLVDINNDGKKDFLFLDREYLFAFNQKGDSIWTLKLDDRIYPKVETFYGNIIDSCNIAVYNIDKNTFDFINSNGEFIEKGEYAASDNFIIYQTTKAKQIRLITAKKRVVSNYLLK